MRLRIPHPYRRPLLLALLIGFLIFTLFPLVRLKIAALKYPIPGAILTLGGGSVREEFTAQFAQNHSSMPIWVSSGISPEAAIKIFHAHGIDSNRLLLDYRAVDTVTNFTTLVSDFQKRNIHHLYLITTDFHLPRAEWIASIVLGSRGITFTPVSIPSRRESHYIVQTLRDVVRSYFWMVTNRTGSSITVWVEPQRKNRFSGLDNTDIRFFSLHAP